MEGAPRIREKVNGSRGYQTSPTPKKKLGRNRWRFAMGHLLQMRNCKSLIFLVPLASTDMT
jgi:hypothetical protein